MERLRESLAYNPETGAVTWLVTRGLARAGAKAGTVCLDGYTRLMFQGKSLAVHRVVWFLMTGDWPVGPLDHVNCDRSDNRWINLRSATPSQNSGNRRGFGQYSKGTTLHRTGKYQAQIKANDKNIYLGLFDTEELAAKAYADKAREIFGDFARSS